MKLENLLNLIALCIGLIAGIFFAIGAIMTSYKVIAEWSSSFYDVNPHLIAAFVGQKVDYTLGSLFLIVSFGISILSYFLPEKCLERIIPSHWKYFAVVGALVIFTISLSLRNPIAQWQVANVKRIAQEVN